jgi:hypothetical protein
MIATLEAAICADLGTLPGVATCRPYAGELDDTPPATLRVPALLVTLALVRVLPDIGTGEIMLRTLWSVLVCTRLATGAAERGQSAWALATAVLLRARANSWAVPGVAPALLAKPERAEDEPSAKPVWQLEGRALAVREVRWSQDLCLGASEWDGGTRPEEIWFGVAPRIGDMGGSADDYWLVAEAPATGAQPL